jgi:DNA helicase INO80
VCDEKYFRRTKWHFMVCDEAQALKSAASGRWKTLLGFSCRNRLLLTGTPVQNTMAELWALLHFIMPQLFDSHDQFAEWFSKGVEGAVTDGAALNAHQLARLHAVLKPFMLRRVKADVESEMAPKTEHLVRCALAPRQQALYAAVKARISIADLLAAAGAGLSEKKTANLMNVVIQLRKVCNHPELFEARPPRASLRWGAPPTVAPPPPSGATAAVLAALGAGGVTVGDTGAAGASGAGGAESVYGPESGGGHGWSSSFITWHLPKLVWRHGLPCLTGAPFTGGPPHASWAAAHSPGLCVWSTAHVAQAALADTSCWGWTRLVELSPAQLVACANAASDPVTAWTLRTLFSARSSSTAPPQHADHASDAATAASQRVARLSVLLPPRVSPHWLCDDGDGGGSIPLLVPIATRFLTAAPLLRAVQCYMPVCTAPPVRVVCSDRGFAVQQSALGSDPALWLLFTGDEAIAPVEARTHAPHPLLRRLAAERWPLAPLWGCVTSAFGSSSPDYRVEDYSLAAALADSGKMQALDALLRERFAGGHKCLVFSQMTRMLDLLEAYCRYRKWKYCRLDGSTSVADRRDMVHAWQAPGDTHFVFLLSTRAGGLGINLTAADTVIFYDNDWNPTMDAQAMDRAHRLGQQRPVAVYRLVCAATVEERILLRAQQKQTVQALVMAEDANAAAAALAGAAAGGGAAADGGDVFAPEEVVSLLLDDEELAAQIAASRQQRARQAPGGTAAASTKRARGIRMADDGETVLVDADDVAAAPPEGGDPAALGLDAPKAKAAPKRRRPAAPKAPKPAPADALPAAPPPPKPSAPPQAPQPVASVQPPPEPAAPPAAAPPPAGETEGGGGAPPVKMSFKIKLKGL